MTEVVRKIHHTPTPLLKGEGEFIRLKEEGIKKKPEGAFSVLFALLLVQLPILLFVQLLVLVPILLLIVLFSCYLLLPIFTVCS